MNYVNGEILNDAESDAVLENIDEMILRTLAKPPLDINRVINACDALAADIDRLGIDKMMPGLGADQSLAEMYIGQIKHAFSADSIRKRLEIELGENYAAPRELVYLHSGAKAAQTIAPLGVLFHITAGNVDGLPFVSLLEGLLTGNINIVKLPKEEGGITVALLQELFKIEPALCEYVYVFDYSSKDIAAMKKLAQAADAVVVWGGDEAVRAVRALASPNTKIVEWGHKISFAYVTKSGANDSGALAKLARSICLTNQLFCSSCQGVFLDTDDIGDIYGFCASFLPVLDKAASEIPLSFGAAERLFIQAKITLDIYHQRIENRDTQNRVFTGERCSIAACQDSRLEPSIMYRNIWVKPLKKEDVLRLLRPYKGYLQTAALICGEHEHGGLARLLTRAGIVKVSDGFEMSNYAFGEAHDGVFTLRCYTKLVSVQKAR